MRRQKEMRQMSIVSDNLRTILGELNMSQMDFAKSVGTSFGYFNMVFNSRRTSISRQLALLIEEKYGYSADWLLHGEGDKKVHFYKCKKMYKDIKTEINRLSLDEFNCLSKFVISLEENDKIEREKRNLKKQNHRVV
jgi:transcriptional regulator with XRE-family HTH domain